MLNIQVAFQPFKAASVPLTVYRSSSFARSLSHYSTLLLVVAISLTFSLCTCALYGPKTKAKSMPRVASGILIKSTPTTTAKASVKNHKKSNKKKSIAYIRALADYVYDAWARRLSNENQNKSDNKRSTIK